MSHLSQTSTTNADSGLNEQSRVPFTVAHSELSEWVDRVSILLRCQTDRWLNDSTVPTTGVYYCSVISVSTEQVTTVSSYQTHLAVSLVVWNGQPLGCPLLYDLRWHDTCPSPLHILTLSLIVSTPLGIVRHHSYILQSSSPW